jgi:hypothetical protein
MLKIQGLVWLGALALAVVREPHHEPALQPGDVVFQASRSVERCGAVDGAEPFAWNHAGVVEVGSDGTWVIEAGETVRRTPWRSWRRHGAEGRALVLRAAGLDAAARERVAAAAHAEVGSRRDARTEGGGCPSSGLVVAAFERGAGLTLERGLPAMAADPRLQRVAD